MHIYEALKLEKAPTYHQAKFVLSSHIALRFHRPLILERGNDSIIAASPRPVTGKQVEHVFLVLGNLLRGQQESLSDDK